MTDTITPAAPPEHETKTSVAAALEAATAAIGIARDELDTVIADIERLNGEIHRIKSAPPHADDIAAAFTRGLDHECKAFKEQLGWHLNSANATALDAAQAVTGNGQLLTLDREHQSGAKLIPGKFKVKGDAISVAALTYFLRDKIAAEIPELVAELCPGATGGIRQADRVEKLRELEAERVTKIARQDELKAMLAEVQQSVYRRG